MRVRFLRLPQICLLPLLILVAFFGRPEGVQAQDQDPQAFEVVAEIFQKRCLSCHNSTDRKGDFSLQTAAALGESGYVEAGSPGESHLLDAITSEAGKRPGMPKNGEPLSRADVAVIRKWIQAGAKWPKERQLTEPVVDNFDWWSFKPIVRPDVPLIKVGSVEADWVQNPIDAFVLVRMLGKKLHPSVEADRRTLIRRLTFDLIGLPPTPNEIDAFVNDDDPRAYERLVERLLKSPHYGERWARHWLDVVKYADTCGYDKDKLRPNAWPYRDYVIRSFNDDKPYSRFVQEQIAGDVLFPGTSDGILGLGFVAAGPWDFIGHVEVPEAKIDGKVARHIDRDEMATNTLNTFCSVTIQCARCHNHKFDPFTQEHYYSLQSVFAAVDKAERQYDLDPAVEKQRHELAEQLATLQAELKLLDEQIKKDGGAELAAAEKQIAELTPKTKPKARRPEYGYHSHIVANQNTTKWVQVDLGKPYEISKIVLRPCHDEFNNIGAGFGFPVRFSVSAFVADPKDEEGAIPILLDQTKADFPNPALVPVEVNAPTMTARFIRVDATKLAKRSNDFMFALAELQVLDKDGNNIAKGMKVTSLDSIQAPVRWARKNLTDGIWPEGGDPEAVTALGEATKKRQTILARINTPARTAQRDNLIKNIAANQKAASGLPKGRMVYAAATSFATQGNFKPTMGKPRLIRVLHRGNIQQPLEEVRPGRVPLSAKDDWHLSLDEGHSEADRRAALARWITDRKHPLTWRSIVNRVWMYHFGQAIVDSPNDFGRMGQLPSHPELLDWLAAEFRDGGSSGKGQSFKDLHRLIVTSSTYRQASTHNDVYSKIDSSNRYLWRMNRRRLEAEEIRDSLLSASGQLNKEMGGPGYYLFALEKTAHSPHYEYHKFDHSDPKSYRRSVYRFIVRSQPDPFMTTLDCADSSQSTPKRSETLTSLQALSMLNNKFNLVMAQKFSARLEAENNTLADQVNRGVRLAVGRNPSVAEQQAMEAYAKEHGLANLCRVLFNMSEFVFVD
jgi:mono/diheme cytochrome c family protein